MDVYCCFKAILCKLISYIIYIIHIYILYMIKLCISWHRRLCNHLTIISCMWCWLWSCCCGLLCCLCCCVMFLTAVWARVQNCLPDGTAKLYWIDLNNFREVIHNVVTFYNPISFGWIIINLSIAEIQSTSTKHPLSFSWSFLHIDLGGPNRFSIDINTAQVRLRSKVWRSKRTRSTLLLPTDVRTMMPLYTVCLCEKDW